MEKDVDDVNRMGKLDFILTSAHSQVCRRERKVMQIVAEHILSLSYG